MKISTINPVTIDGKRISKPSEYLNADGDYYGADGGSDEFYDADGDDDFYGFDASGKPVKGNKSEITQFQNFANSKGETLVVDGIWGAKSETAWGKWGSDFAKSLGLGGGSGNSATTPTTTPSKDEQIAQAKKGKIWDKAKGWVTSDKAKDVLKSLLEGGGFMGALNTLLGGGTSTPPADSTPSGTPSGTPAPTGMSKGAKIGIAVGIVAVLGIVIYVATRPKK